MYKSLKIDGLNCASCAEKIEIKLKKVPWIEDVNLNFAMGNIQIKTNDNDLYSLPQLQKVIDDIEEGVLLKDSPSADESPKLLDNKGFIKILISLPLFIAGLLLHDQSIAYFTLLGTAYLISGYEVLFRAIRNILKGQFFDEFFLMSMATIGAFIVGETAEGVGVMIFFQLGEFFQDLAVGKSKHSIKSLMSLKPEFVRLQNGEIIKPELATPGQIIEVRPGEKIPTDGIIISGETTVDSKTITGESIPKLIKESEEVLSGYINISSVIKVEVTKTLEDSTVNKILEMVQNETSKKTKTENFISRFSRIYTPIVVISALIIAVISPMIIQSWTYDDSIYKALIFLVISCPCALVISVPLGYFGGLGRGSKAGILIKGSTHLDDLCNITKFSFDKTGTLTEGFFSIQSVDSVIPQDQLMDIAYKIEFKSNHPIAVAITTYTGITENLEPTFYQEIPGRGVIATYSDQSYIGGNRDLLMDQGIDLPDSSNSFGTEFYISQNGLYVGKILLSDSLKPDIKTMVENLGPENVYMLTGDNSASANYIASLAGIINFEHSLLPADKAMFIKALGSKEKVLFAGDGINDAPVLAASSVGVSMGGIGSDAAIQASDIVLMNDEPSKIIDAIKIARFTKKIIIGNIIMALGFKVVIMILGLSGITGLWLAIFADVGVGLLAVLNSIRTLHYKID